MNVRLTIIAATLVSLMTITITSNAANLGKFCWLDNFGATWVLNVADFGSENYSLNGYRKLTSPVCNGVAQLPTTGTAIVVSSTTLSFGAYSTVDSLLRI